MKEHGKVVEAGSDTVVVEVKPHEECHKCGVCGAGRPRRISVSGETARGFSVGDEVEVEIESSEMLKLYSFLYGIPLVAFAGTVLVLYAVTKSPVLSFIGALAVTALAFAVAGIYVKKYPGFVPKIVKRS